MKFNFSYKDESGEEIKCEEYEFFGPVDANIFAQLLMITRPKEQSEIDVTAIN